jgi:hypothetical protein
LYYFESLDFLDAVDIESYLTTWSFESTDDLVENLTKFNLAADSDMQIKDSTGLECTIKNGKISGELAPQSINYVDNGISEVSTLVISFPQSQGYKITPLTDNVEFSIVDRDIYTDIEATGATDITILSDNSIYLAGVDVDYTVAVPSATEETVVQVEGVGDKVDITQKKEGVCVEADSLENMEVATITEDGITSMAVSTDKPKLLVKTDENYVAAYVSDNNDDKYDTPISGETEDSDDTDEISSGVGCSCTYQTHVQNVGWQDLKSNGEMSGTEGQSLRLEGIKINVNSLDTESDLGIEYCTHVENIGWQDFMSDGVMSGTSGQGLRLEAIKIQLTGEDADKYDVYYRVHAQNVGWMGWASNGAESGTAGYGYRLEGIEIQIVEKGADAPGSTSDSFRQAS